MRSRARFYLLRPDLHIAGRWKAIVADEILRNRQPLPGESDAMSAMPSEDFEAAYETLATAIDSAGPEREALFLTRLALVLGHELGDIAAFKNAIRTALEGLANKRLSPGRTDDPASRRLSRQFIPRPPLQFSRRII